MTSRRSIKSPAERESRALQFIPGHVGGRVASAQPIRRRGGTLRRASVGAAGAPAAPPTYLSGATGYLESGGSTTYSIPQGSATTGDLIVAIAAIDSGATFTAPTGWTTLVSGQVTNLGYWIGWRILTGSDDMDLERSTGTSTGLVLTRRYTDVAAGLSMTATAVTEQTTVSSTDMVTPSPSWMMPMQAIWWLRGSSPNYTGYNVDGTVTWDTSPANYGGMWGQESGYGTLTMWNSWADQSDDGTHAGKWFNSSTSYTSPPPTEKTVPELAKLAWGFV